MTDLEEYQGSFNPTIDDGLKDADGDRYPNVFEVRRGSNPNSAASTPTANYSVSPGGSYPTLGSAITAANVANGSHQVIAVAPGTYSGTNNVALTIGGAGKPKFLIIGTGGAATTIFDGGGANLGWTVSVTSVLESLTIQNTTRALYLSTTGVELRLVDAILR
jgi:pectin methylesterase-like acyl-CoA thioesterase